MDQDFKTLFKKIDKNMYNLGIVLTSLIEDPNLSPSFFKYYVKAGTKDYPNIVCPVTFIGGISDSELLDQDYKMIIPKYLPKEIKDLNSKNEGKKIITTLSDWLKTYGIFFEKITNKEDDVDEIFLLNKKKIFKEL